MSSASEFSLESVTTVALFKELERRLQSSGALAQSKKKAIKSKSSTAPAATEPEASASDGASVQSKRSVGAGTAAWIDVSGKVTLLVKEVKAELTAEAKSKGKEEPKFGSVHLKAAGYLKKDLTNEDKSFKEPTLAQVRTAVTFLLANPDYKSPNALKNEAKKAAAPAAPSAPAEPKAKKEPKAKEQPKAASVPAPAPAPAPAAAAEEDEDSVDPLEVDGEDYYYQASTGKVWLASGEVEEDNAIGTYDGAKITLF